MVRAGARIGAAAFVLGLSVAGPAAVAVADGSSGDSSPGRASSSPSRSEASSPASPTETGPRPRIGARSVNVSSDSAAAAPAAAVSASSKRGRTAGSGVSGVTQADIPAVPSAAVATAKSPLAAVPASVAAAAQQTLAATPTKAVAAIPASPAAATLKSAIAYAAVPVKWKSKPVDGTPIGPIESAVVGAMAAIDRVDTAIYGTLDATAKWLSGLPATPFTELLQGTLLLTRRTFFDQAPTVNPVQETGQVSGEITGEVGAKDAENEAITYKIVEGPTAGKVVIGSDGKYTYTPGPNFKGSDAFVVQAIDNTGKGVQGNVLEPRRLPGTDAFVAVKQGTQPTITFTFAKFKDKAQAVWDAPTNEQSLTALKWTAFKLAQNFDPQYSVTLNYELGLAARGLASASSDPINGQDPGFWMTVVQNRIINGTNPTNATIDGEINMNFDNQWSYYGQADKNKEEYSFQSTMGHELLHSFGFLSWVGKPPKCNMVYCNAESEPITPEETKKLWFDFDQYIGNSKEQYPINKTKYLWNTAFDKYVTGGGTGDPGKPNAKYLPDGLYFWGQNAVAEFGGKPVPLYSPDPFQLGSSASHLSDYYFNDVTAPMQMMNSTGQPGEKNLPVSAVEKAILEDLGYTMR